MHAVALTALRFAALCILASSVIAFVAAGVDPLTPEHPDFAQPWDHHHYIEMAEGELLSHEEAPYNRRPLTPAIVTLLPVDTQTGFRALTFLCLAGTGVALYYALKEVGFTPVLSLTGSLLFFSLSWVIEFLLVDFWLTDPLAFFLLALSFWAAVSGKAIAFAVLLALGALNKEAAVFALAFFYGLRARALFDYNALVKTLLVGLPAALILVALRIGISAENTYSYLDLLARIPPVRLEELLASDAVIAKYTFGALGVAACVLPIFALADKRGVALALRFAPFVLLVYSQLLFANNTERLLVLCFPAVITLSMFGLANIAKTFSIREAFFLPLPLLILVLNNRLTDSGANEPVEYQALLLLIYLAATFVIGQRARTRKEQ